jgi:hypothetical protein
MLACQISGKGIISAYGIAQMHACFSGKTGRSIRQMSPRPPTDRPRIPDTPPPGRGDRPAADRPCDGQTKRGLIQHPDSAPIASGPDGAGPGGHTNRSNR